MRRSPRKVEMWAGAGAGRPKLISWLTLRRPPNCFTSPTAPPSRIDINGHRETWPIRSKGFKRWLARLFYDATQGAPSSEALASALNVIEAKANYDAPERIVHIRVGGLDGRLYLDL